MKARSYSRILAALALVGVIAAVASAQVPVFFQAGTNAAVASATVVIAAPVIGDAHPDLIAGMAPSPSLDIVDAFSASPSPSVVLALPATPRQLRALDLDADGDHDIVAASDGSAGDWLSVFLNTPAGFVRTDYAVTSTTFDPIDPADIDGDGDIDLVFQRAIFLNDGSGGLLPGPVITLAPNSKRLQPGDFDGDGDTDLLAHMNGTASGGNGEVLRILRRNANGSYTSLATQLAVPLPPAADIAGAAAIGDVDGDGADDVVLATGGLLSDHNSAIVQTWKGSANGVLTPLAPFVFFAPEFTYYSTAFIGPKRRIFLGDVDSDGDLDLYYSSGRYPAFLVNANGLWSPAAGAGLGAIPGGTALLGPTEYVDFDLDGDLDMVACQAAAPRAVVTFANGLGAPSPATAIGPTPSFVCNDYVAGTGSGGYYTWTGFGGHLSPELGDVNQIFVPVVDATGSANLAGVWTYGSFAPGTAPSPVPGAYWTISSYDGKAGFNAAPPGIVGNYSITATPSAGAPTTFVLEFDNDVVVPIGSGITVPTSTASVQPVGFFVGYRSGQPVVNVPLTIQTISGPQIGFLEEEFPGWTWFNSGSGTILLHPIGAPTPGTSVIRLSAAYQYEGHTADLTITTVQGPVMYLSSDHIVRTGIGEPFPEPITVRILAAPGGPPLVGETVEFFGAPLPESPTADVPLPLLASAVTDVNGRASTTFHAGTWPGNFRLYGQWSAGGRAFAYARVSRLRLLPSSPTQATFELIHGEYLQPFSIAADLPMSGPGYVQTNVGRFYTSILAPQATLLVYDGLGLAGPINGNAIFTSPGGYTPPFTLPVPPLGITMIVQGYSLTTTETFPNNLIISNPVTIQL